MSCWLQPLKQYQSAWTIISKLCLSRTCLAWKGFTKTKRRRPTCRQQGTKSLSRPVDKPLTNWLQTVRQPLILFPHTVYIGFCLILLLGRRSGDVSSIPWGESGTLVVWATCAVGAPSCPALPRRSAVRFEPSRPWYARVLDSTNLLKMELKYFCDPGFNFVSNILVFNLCSVVSICGQIIASI